MKNKKILFSILLLAACFLSTNLAFAREFEISWPEIPGTEFVVGGKCPDEGCPPRESLSDFVSYVFTFSLTIIGFVAFFNLVYAGILYMTAGIDPSKKSQAMDKIKNSVLGIMLLFGSYLILNAINPELVALGEAPQKGGGISSLNSIILYQGTNCNIGDVIAATPALDKLPCNTNKDCIPVSEGGNCNGDCTIGWSCDLNLNDPIMAEEDRKAGLCINEQGREEISDETATSSFDVGSVKINGEIIIRLCQGEDFANCAIIELMDKSTDGIEQCTIKNTNNISALTPSAAARPYISGVGDDFSGGNLKSAKIEGNFHRTKTILFSGTNYGGDSQSHTHGCQSTEIGDVGDRNAWSIYIKKDPPIPPPEPTNLVAILCQEPRGDCEIESEPNPDLSAGSSFGPPPTFNNTIAGETKFICTFDRLDTCSGVLLETGVGGGGRTDFFSVNSIHILNDAGIGVNTATAAIKIGSDCETNYWTDSYKGCTGGEDCCGPSPALPAAPAPGANCIEVY